MSYIPDYRKETDKLNEVDRAYIEGYRRAVADASNFFNDAEVFSGGSLEGMLLASIEKHLKDWMRIEEITTVCSLFDHADYLPDDIELIDANKPLYQNTKGAKAE